MTPSFWCRAIGVGFLAAVPAAAQASIDAVCGHDAPPALAPVCSDDRERALLATVLGLYDAVEAAALDPDMVVEDRTFWLERLGGAPDRVEALREADGRLRAALGNVALSRETLHHVSDLGAVCLTLGYPALRGDISCTVESFGPLAVLTPREGNDWFVMQTQAYRRADADGPGEGDAGERGFVVFEPAAGAPELLRPIYAEVQLGQINAPVLVDTPLGEAIVGDQRVGRFLLRREDGMQPFETDPDLLPKVEALFPDHTAGDAWVDFATFTYMVHLVPKNAPMGDDGGFESLPLSLVDNRLILAMEGP